MSEKFPFSIWNYNKIDEFNHIGGKTLDEVSIWAECGLTVPMTPIVDAEPENLKKLLPILDEAQEKGIQVIAFVSGLTYDRLGALGAAEYEKQFRRAYMILKHPALFGFFIGDEPSDKKAFIDCAEALKLQTQIAPELKPYLNLHTNMDRVPPELFGGITFREWLVKTAKESGMSIFSYGHYDQMSGGIESYYSNLKALSEAADAAQVDMWNTMLLSGHYVFRVPTEYDIMWQITTAAACGSRGIVWFRYYDHQVVQNYHGSPVDEFGYLTYSYYKLLRCQRRFNDQYGELIMRLHHTKSYLTGSSVGGMEVFKNGSHPYISGIRCTEQAVVGFFTDDDGVEYMALVDASQTNPGVYKIDHDRSKLRIEELTFNGKCASDYGPMNTDEHWDGVWLYPGQMNLFRLTVK